MTESDLAHTFPDVEDLGPGGLPWLHADPAGGTPVADSVVRAMTAALRIESSNPNRPNPLSERMATLVASAREEFAAFADGYSAGTFFGPNSSTVNWHFARAIGRTLQPGDSIVCTQLDHECNVSPWLSIAEAAGAEVRFIPLDPDTFEPDTAALDHLTDESTRVIAFSRASNLLGTILPPEPFVQAAKAVGAITVADAVAFTPHAPLRQREWDIDVQFCSPYKFFGPHMGVLSAKPEILEGLRPDRLRPAPSSGPRAWEVGMPSFAEIEGLRSCIKHVSTIGYSTIAERELALTQRALNGFTQIPRIRLYGKRSADGREPIFAFTVDGLAPATVARRMADRGIIVSAGTNYAIEALRALGLSESEGVNRLGFVHHHTTDDVDRALTALSEIAK